MSTTTEQQTGFGPLSEEETNVLKDIVTAIEFALRNGFSFAGIISAIGHDVNGFARYGFDVAQSRRDCFLAKTASLAQSAREEVGEPSDEQN